MPKNQPSRDRNETDDRFASTVGRRTFIAAGSGASATLLAGCISGSSPTGGDADASEDGDAEDSTDDADSANFRLLISDMPADIGDFERLDVSFDRARIFDGGNEESDGDGSDEEQAKDDEEKEDADDEEQADDGDGADDPDGEDDESGDGNEKDDEESDDGVERKRGFYVIDLDGATVDLTQVIGDKAKSVCDVELSDGTYQKIELHVSDVEGIVDGEEVAVKVPSEKLQLTSPFEVGGDEPVEFVFDINVVKRGPDNGYILKPVISKSGVNGKDVDVEDVDDDEDEDEDESDEKEDEKSESSDGNDDDDADGDGEEDADNGDEAENEDGTDENAGGADN
ncbi:DUF4382 domain-containing protein [Halosolutus amylolyticus]|uniref:DUF4382 domain-containing protein n=1 Tax=Halosolutus amylolyticus TaxID=2932267 RepID=A0ABD5PJV7_9EURY|nr:DUF4382 domain-containing protein [Halosolutus amylolyticus]